MKVLEEGNHWRKSRCPHCQAKLEVEESDISLKHDRDEDGAPESAAFVRCGYCREWFRISVPYSIIRARLESERLSDYDL